MHIVFICLEYAPYLNRSSAATDAVLLAKALKQNGHEVSVLIPSIEGVALSAHSLARRLSPQVARVGGVEYPAVRFDGRTADGIAVNLLDITARTEPAVVDSTVRSAHAAAFLAGLAEAPEVCIFFGKDFIGAAEAARQYAALSETVLLSDLRGESTGEIVDAALADRVIVSRSADVPERDAARFAVISKAAPADWVEDKASEKTAFQMRFGLKVRRDVPLTLFYEFSKEQLAAYLVADVQAVIPDDRTDCAALKERYPDRLVAAARGDLDFAMRAADGCVLCGDAAPVPLSLARAAVPIVTAEALEDVVDLEPGLTSGTGIVLRSPNPRDAAEGMSRWIAAFHMHEAFFALQKRLPEYAVTWNRVATYIEHLVEEVKTENK